MDLLTQNPNLLVMAIAAAALLLVVGLGSLLTNNDGERRMRQRMARVAAPRSAGQGEDAQPRTLRRRQSDSSVIGVDALIRRFMPNIERLRQKLERTGWNLRAGDFLLGCLGLGVVVGGALILLGGMSPLLAGLFAVVAAVGVPNYVVRAAAKRRAKKFMAQLPEAVELIVRGIRSGLPVSEAINTIGHEMDDPISGTFRFVSDQVKIGTPLDEALWATARRLDVPEFRFFVISLSIQQETGGNLAEILENLGNMIRRREQVKLKIRAMSSEAKASAMIIGSLPFVMAGILYVVNTEYIMQLFTDPRGWVMLAVGATSQTIGIAIMAKMIRFEI